MINYIKSLLNSIFDFGSGTFEDAPFADAVLNTCKHEFQKWAFGDEYTSLSVKDKIDHWNVAHGDDYLITPKQNVNEALKQMIMLYNRKKIRDLTNDPETVISE